MQYQSFIRTDSGIRTADFLSAGAKQYLDTCDDEVLEVWTKRRAETSDRSLANTLKETILKRFVEKSIRIRSVDSEDYSILWLFQHRNDTEGKFVEMYKECWSRGISDAFVVTQTKNFRDKFHFDGSAMTHETVLEDLNQFVTLFKPDLQLRMYLLVFEDLEYNASPEKKSQGRLRLTRKLKA